MNVQQIHDKVLILTHYYEKNASQTNMRSFHAISCHSHIKKFGETGDKIDKTSKALVLHVAVQWSIPGTPKGVLSPLKMSSNCRARSKPETLPDITSLSSKISGNSLYWWGYDEKGTLIHCWGNIIWFNFYGKQYKDLSQKKE